MNHPIKATVGTSNKKMKGRVRWDDANINEIEANKPVRKKIIEPKTPYHPMIVDDGSSSPTRNSVSNNGFAAHAEAVRSALSKVTCGQEQSSHFGGWISSEDEAHTMEEDKGPMQQRQSVGFEEHRRKHYDEFRKVKEVERKGCGSDHEDGDCSGGDDGSCESKEIDIDSVDDIVKTITTK